MLSLRARVDEIYAKHTGQALERVHADMERDRYFTGEEPWHMACRSRDRASRVRSRRLRIQSELDASRGATRDRPQAPVESPRDAS